MAKVSVRIDDDVFKRIDKELSNLQNIERMPAIKRGIRAAGNVIKARLKEVLPKPGYPGDKPDLKPLRDTVAVRVKEYKSRVVVATVGYAYPAGAHGHLIEEGHRLVSHGGTEIGHVRGYHYLKRAADATHAESNAAFESSILDAIQEAKVTA